MDTDRSEKMARDFLAQGHPYKRKVHTVSQFFEHPPAKVFAQLCPTRETDWIDGWRADLIYTSTGYVEPDCVFTTPADNVFGPGVWVFSRYEPDSLVELVRVVEHHLVEQIRISLEDHGNGTCTGVWNLRFTALTEKGNNMVDAIPGEDRHLQHIVSGLDFFLKTGQLMRKFEKPER